MSTRKVNRYVEAQREVLTLRRQLEDYPELRDSRRWMDSYNLAVSRAHEFFRALTGGEMAHAHKLLKGTPDAS